MIGGSQVRVLRQLEPGGGAVSLLEAPFGFAERCGVGWSGLRTAPVPAGNELPKRIQSWSEG